MLLDSLAHHHVRALNRTALEMADVAIGICNRFDIDAHALSFALFEVEGNLQSPYPTTDFDTLLRLSDSPGRVIAAIGGLHKKVHDELGINCWCNAYQQVTEQLSAAPKSISARSALSFQLWQRGIKRAATLMGWREEVYKDATGWSYPVVNESGKTTARRWKASAGQSGPKYVWLEDARAEFYFHPVCFDYTYKRGRSLIWAAGEIDVLTFLEAGIYNVMCSFGEMNFPEAFIPMLQGLGIKQVAVYPDLDETGDKMVARMRDILPPEIELKAFSLPWILGGKADTNDLWRAVGRDKPLFRSVLSALPEHTPCKLTPVVKLPSRKKKRKKKEQGQGQTAEQKSDVDWDAFRFLWVSEVVIPAIASRANGRPERQFSCVNPAHPDKKPSARVSYDLGRDDPRYMCQCAPNGTSWDWQDVGLWVGAEDFVEWCKRTEKLKP